MDETTLALLRALKDRIDREAELFTSLGNDVQRLRDSFQSNPLSTSAPYPLSTSAVNPLSTSAGWGPSLTVAESIELSSHAVEEADAARDAAFEEVRDALHLPRETSMSSILPALPDLLRSEMEESWRGLRMAVVRLKTATGRMRYSAETLASTLNGILEEVFPYRKGKIYSRRGTTTSVSGAVLVDQRR